MGFYGIQNPIIIENDYNSERYPNSNDSLHFKFNYNSMFYEYTWYKTKRWELSSPVHLGIGAVDLSYRDTVIQKNTSIFNGNASIFVSSGEAQFKITRWFAIGAGIGYRVVFSRNEDLMQGLNAPIYDYRAKLLLGELFRVWFKKDYVNEDWD